MSERLLVMRRIIGVCLAKANSEFSREFIKNLHSVALKKDVKIIVYNSVCEISDPNKNKGARSVFYNIPYDKLCAVVILYGAVAEPTLVERIIKDAKNSNVPVIMARKYDPRCISVIGEYLDEYTEMLKKIIKDRNITDSVYVAGKNKPEVDYDSKLRIQCYKNALEDCGQEFKLDNLYFGQFWEMPTLDVAKKILKNRDKMPDAVFCANDLMAQMIIKEFQENNIRVPEDVVVTGFDGTECYRCSSPNITTCLERMDELSEKIFEAIDDAQNDKTLSNAYYYKYEAIYSESCGYPNAMDDSVQMTGRRLYDLMRFNRIDEEYSGYWIDGILENPCLNNFYKKIPDFVSDKICIAMTPVQIAKVITHNYHALEDNLVLYARDESSNLPRADRFLTKYMTPDFENWLEDSSVCYISSLFVDDNCYGVIYERSFSPDKFGYSAHRHAVMLNNALLICVKSEK